MPNSDNSIFSHEITVLENAQKQLHSNELSADNFKYLTDEYEALLKQFKKIVKIGDNTQKKLRNTQLELEEKNKQVNYQNSELTLLNEQKGELLEQINKDISRAVKYVRQLLPTTFDFDGVCFDWKYIPSSQLGGDALGYSDLGNGIYSVYLLDASGHGIGSALHSISALSTIKFRSLRGVDFREPSEVLSGLNRIFKMADHDDLYFTIWYGVIDLNKHILKYANAGHEPAFLKSENEFHELFCENIFIGAFDSIEFESKEINIDKGSEIIIYSDGAYEIKKNDGTFYSLSEFRNFIKGSTLQQGLDSVYQNAISINDNQTLEDDFSVLRVKINK